MIIKPPSKVYIKESPVHGLGVFADQPFSPGQIIEICPVVDIGIKRGEITNFLKDYRFNWPQGIEDWEKQVMPLGYGCIYNHRDEPNANWRSNLQTNCFEYYALTKIKRHEEIFTWYGGPEYWNDNRGEIIVV